MLEIICTFELMSRTSVNDVVTIHAVRMFSWMHVVPVRNVCAAECAIYNLSTTLLCSSFTDQGTGPTTWITSLWPCVTVQSQRLETQGHLPPNSAWSCTWAGLCHIARFKRSVGIMGITQYQFRLNLIFIYLTISLSSLLLVWFCIPP